MNEAYLIKEFPAYGGTCKRYRFPNDYGASVVNHSFSYGLELAVLDFSEDEEGELTYSTEITDDVIGHLDNDKVEELLEDIKRLKR